MTALRGELEEKAGRELENPFEPNKRWVVQAYFQQSIGEYWPDKCKGVQLQQKIDALKEKAPDPGLSSFPRRTPTASPGLRLEHRFAPICICKKAPDTGVFLLQSLTRSALELLPAVTSRC